MTLNDADPKFIEKLSGLLPENTLSAPDPRYLEEPRGRFYGQGGVLARPRSTSEVATILRACNAAQVPVVPYGGGTGLVGGQVGPELAAPLILSLERMNKVRAVYPAANVIVAEAGCILANVQAAAEAENRLFPLSLAAQGTAQIGGNLATNAGGLNVLRYGNARDLCLGLEAVLPNGEIWNGLSRLRKDNTGYDLRNLLIGAEGTLGVITAASLKLFPQTVERGTALLVVPSPQAALELLSLAQDMIGEGISAFEMIHGTGLAFLAETMPELRQPFADLPDWMVLIDLGLPAGRAASGILEALFAAGFERELVSDGLVAQSETQRADFWTIRESIPAANKRIGSISSHDVSVPIERIPAFIDEGFARIAEIGSFRVNSFGHLGDGNLHYNVFPPKGQDRSLFKHLQEEVKSAVHDLVHAYGGSVSAEHGVGRLKTGDLEKYGDPVKLQTMRAIKNALDPNGIMNPGAVLRQEA